MVGLLATRRVGHEHHGAGVREVIEFMSVAALIKELEIIDQACVHRVGKA